MSGPGIILDRYELLSRLAAGGMGEVHLARLQSATGFESLVAIKVLLPNLCTHRSFVTMFLDEARNVSKLRHQNIVQIQDIAEHAGQYYMVMEYIPGQNLRQLLADLSIPDRPLFAPPLGAQIFADLASALAMVHGVGLVHRDLSPNNIMIGDDGVAKLIDFGVARALGTVSLTTPGTLKGKFTYMAPEYIRSQRYDHRVDIFSLGVVMWETFARRRLFRGAHAAEQLHQVLEAEIPRLDTEVPGFPSKLADLVAGALERDVERRIASASSLSDALSELAHPRATDATLRTWLELRIPARIAERRQRDQAITASTAGAFPSGPSEPSGDDYSEIRGLPSPAIHASSNGTSGIRSTDNSGTSIRAATGEALGPVGAIHPRARIGAVVIGATIIAAAVAVVLAVGFRADRTHEAPAPARVPAAAPAPAVAPQRADPALDHRRSGLEAMAAKDYAKAISEFAEALRLSGDPELIRLMDLARTLRRDAPRPTRGDEPSRSRPTTTDAVLDHADVRPKVDLKTKER